MRKLLYALTGFWRKTWYFWVILGAAVIFLLPFWMGERRVIGHDTNYHVVAVMGRAELPFPDFLNAKVIGEISNDLGMGVGIFYPSFSHNLATIIFKLIQPFGLSVFTACHLANLLMLFVSGCLIYRLLMLLRGKRLAAVLSAILYMGATYHLSGILVRDAFAEVAIFVFMPLVGIALYYLYKERYRKFLVYGVLGCSGLVYSHLVMTMYVAAFLAIFVLINWRKFISIKKVAYALLVFVLAAVVCAPFLLPMLENMRNAQYLAFYGGFMTNRDFGLVPFSSYFDLGYTDNRVMWALNIFVLLFCVGALVLRGRLQKDRVFVYSLVVVSLLCVAVMSLLPLEGLPEFVKMIQFPWRLNLVLCFSIAVLAGVLLADFDGVRARLVFAVLAATTFVMASFVWQVTAYSNDLSEQSAVEFSNGFMDYLPIASSDRFDEMSDRKEMGVLVVDGKAKISDYRDEMPDLGFSIRGEGNLRLELPRYYNLGYEVLLEKDGVLYELEYFEGERGLIELEVVLNGAARVSVSYVGTKLGQIAVWAAVIVLASLVLMLWYDQRV